MNAPMDAEEKGLVSVDRAEHSIPKHDTQLKRKEKHAVRQN
jgi:hypothetical protein